MSASSRRQRRLQFEDDDDDDAASETCSESRSETAGSETATSTASSVLSRQARRQLRRGQPLPSYPESDSDPEPTSSELDPSNPSDPPGPPVGRGRRRARGRPGSSEGEVTESAGAALRRKQREAPAPDGLRVPSALPDELAEVEKRLLSTPMRVDDEDIFPDDYEPHPYMQPPVPSLGAAKEVYTEVGGGGARPFRRVAAAAGGGGGTESDGGTAEGGGRNGGLSSGGETRGAYEPSVTSRVLMILLGLVFRGAHGTLAGLCLMQLVVVPGFGATRLTEHLAYAPCAMPLQRAMSTVAVLAFLGDETCPFHWPLSLAFLGDET